MPNAGPVGCLATSVLYQGNEIEIQVKYDAQYFKKWFIWVEPVRRARPNTGKTLRAKLIQLKASISRFLTGGGEWEDVGVTDFGLFYHETDDPDFGQEVVQKTIERMPEVEWDGAWWVCPNQIRKK